jgi:hypothetical protein
MFHLVIIPDFVSKNGLLNKIERNLFSNTSQFPIIGYHKELLIKIAVDLSLGISLCNIILSWE